MANVEKLLILPQNLTSQQVETVVDTYRGVIEQNGGRLEEIEMWGVKPLAYRIKKNRKAHFALLNIDAPPAAIAEMERQMQTSEDVLRHMTIRVEELESEPSATMQKRDRDDRKDRERGRPRDEPSNTVETGLDLQSSLILSELRSINDDIERALSRGA